MSNFIERDLEIERVVDSQDTTEVIVDAVGKMINGAIGCFACYRLGQMESHDPREEYKYGEQLLIAALDKLRGKR